MTVEAFRLCATPGCTRSVWGPTNEDGHCRAHGGNALGFPEIDDDEYGNPRASSGGSSPPEPRSSDDATLHNTPLPGLQDTPPEDE